MMNAQFQRIKKLPHKGIADTVPHKLSERCTMYPTAEVYRFLAAPVNHRHVQEGCAQ